MRAIATLLITTVSIFSLGQARAGQFAAMIAASAQATRPVPRPAPTPVVGEICDNCDGTGKVGDGQPGSTKDCPVCKGTGRRSSVRFVPMVGDPDDPETQATPMYAIGAGLHALQLKPTDVFVVYGSGPKALWEIVAARDYGVRRVIGVEKDPLVAESARRTVEYNGLSDKITIITGDAVTTDTSEANKGAAYLWPDTLAQLKPKIMKLDRFVSFAHPTPGLGTRQLITKDGDLYLTVKASPLSTTFMPTPVFLTTTPRLASPSSPNVAVYGNRTYTAPVCNSRNCSMCNAIRRQLGR